MSVLKNVDTAHWKAVREAATARYGGGNCQISSNRVGLFRYHKKIPKNALRPLKAYV